MPHQSVVLVVASEDQRSSLLAVHLQQTIQRLSPSLEVTIQSLTDLDLTDESWICPLTLNLPNSLAFPGQNTYYHCREVESVRHRVSEWGYSVGEGNCWLPIVLTQKGPLYAEAIATAHPTPYQPLHLQDTTRQTLYRLGYRLLEEIAALPGVYLLQFGGTDPPRFDRIIPFPDTPALATVGVQEPDLFTSYWYCQLGIPLKDLIVLPPCLSSAQT